MKTAVVTGATGFIGGALVKQLCGAGYYVYAVGRNKNRLDVLARMDNVSAICADFSVYKQLHQQIGVEVDVFFHCAYSGGFGGEALKNYSLQLDNAKYACDAVACALKLESSKFVLASTINTIEIQTILQDSPNASLRYTCIYSASKLVAEIIGKTLAYNNKMEFCTALIAMPYGEGNYAKTLPNIVMQQLINHIPPKLITGENLYDLIYIDDVACGLLAVGESGKDLKNYYVGHRKLITFKKWMERIRNIISPQTELGFGEYPDGPAVNYDLVDLDSLYLDTGFEVTSDFDESIRKTAAWLRNQENIL